MGDQEPQPLATQESEIPQPNAFSVPVEINDLPYLFRGTLPDQPSGFRFTIHIPQWEEWAQKIKEAGTDNPFMMTEARRFEEHEGEIGHITLVKGSDDSIKIAKIQSDTWIMPKDSQYSEARGLGKFLLNNLLTFADMRGWGTSAVPYPDGNGRMDEGDLYMWYVRKGFTGRKSYSMHREPQTPDITQVIAQIVKPRP